MFLNEKYDAMDDTSLFYMSSPLRRCDVRFSPEGLDRPVQIGGELRHCSWCRCLAAALALAPLNDIVRLQRLQAKVARCRLSSKKIAIYTFISKEAAVAGASWAASASAASLTEQTNGWRLPRSDDPSTDSRSIIATEGDGWMARGQDLEVAPEKCTGGRVWKECGSKCTRTCESPPIMPCVMLCVARCECPAGAPIWHNGASCISAEQC
ncbi:hypothetical protein EMIHUDRAFT_239378 [Emiliania huxleyi CCMP1516]|uniref:TIL domain-containing protein n=2 Tax=Emiliania huxleyi TaxID=2903 RepID=A0A0D3JJG3_EMIH1|nr:hypothetical protein EMIHUDRAFT_239378 [Emiliania huxleyi CCMP1516]EOD23648.1 hypothetical protein EMIHUDRAFT_239378 [Emiliania huxleyi CCMP1516]|eukprot:XP_005776077.1 hypothetical protein EMIHUDRAFT_239378 [Emiliania huxleyi CCMP1516]